LRQLFATPGATRLEDCDDALVRRLPGEGVKPSDLARIAHLA
jgi:hypothetical protein